MAAQVESKHSGPVVDRETGPGQAVSWPQACPALAFPMSGLARSLARACLGTAKARPQCKIQEKVFCSKTASFLLKNC